MAERIVTFGPGPNQMNPEHQRKVVDQLLMHLGVEVLHIKDEIYVVRDYKKVPTPFKPEKVLTAKQLREKGKKKVKL
jgi:hypothetical protein